MKRTTMYRLLAMGLVICLLAAIGLLGGCNGKESEKGEPLPPEATKCGGTEQDAANLANLQKPDMIIYYYGETTTKIYSAGTEEFEQVFALNQARQRGDWENQPLKLFLALPRVFYGEELTDTEKVLLEGEGGRWLEYVYTSADHAPIIFQLSDKGDLCFVQYVEKYPDAYGTLNSAEELLTYIDSTMA